MQVAREESLAAEPAPTAQQLIPVYRPDLSGNERRYLLECIESSWISSNGVFIQRFEAAFAEATGAKHAVAVCNGTAALHLALHSLGLSRGDEVIVPTLTFIAPVNAIVLTGATPVFAECRRSDWVTDAADVARRITPRTRAILPVHLYGAACDMRALRELAAAHRLLVIEDCAEALGTTAAGQHVGTFGQVGTFSFFGNKTVTTGEGGMVITDDDALAPRLRQVRGQGQSCTRRYWHEMLGFNYRMTNIEAAIGLAQMERLRALLDRKREIAARYGEALSELPVEFQRPQDGVRSSDWLVSILLPRGTDRDRVMASMASGGVDTRPLFYCAHQMPMYDRGERFPIAEEIAERGISLPSYPTMSDADIGRVTAAVRAALREQGRA
jgi:perosamine synthetase